MFKIVFQNENFTIVCYGINGSMYKLFLNDSNAVVDINCPYLTGEGHPNCISWMNNLTSLNDDLTFTILNMDGEMEETLIDYRNKPL